MARTDMTLDDDGRHGDGINCVMINGFDGGFSGRE